MTNKILSGAIAFLLTLGALVVTTAPAPQPSPVLPIPHQSIPQPPTPQQPRQPNITTRIPGYQDYARINTQLQEWNQQAPDLTEVGIYGKSAKGQDLRYIRVTNKMNNAPRKKVMITACIHGNEPLATSTVMAYIGSILGGYGTDSEITSLVNTTDIYFVPVVSPDSYPDSRHVEGVDPNRNFPGPSNPNRQSSAPVRAIMQFFQQHRFSAVISGHTSGRVLLTPYGDRNEVCPNNADYNRIIGKMAQMCGYGQKRACQVYGTPIHGSEVDWYYRGGAFSIVMEFGTHQRIPSLGDVQTEFNQTFKGVLHFIREAPQVQVLPAISEEFTTVLRDQIRIQLPQSLE